MKIAIIGTGISGLTCGYLLAGTHDITVYEAEDYVGGHTNTIDFTVDGERFRIDTGFIVHNQVNYPNFCRLLKQLNVPTQPSNMSFSVRSDGLDLEYNGTSVNALFAQRRNLVRPRFLRMVRGILRFYEEAPSAAETLGYDVTLGEYLERGGYSREFIDWHILPMGAAIWSSGTEQVRDFPFRYFVEFFRHHGFLKVSDRPQWRVIEGGSSRYIEPLIASFADRIRLNCPVVSVRRTPSAVELTTGRGEAEVFDQVIVATHSDQALGLLADASESETEVLSAIRYEGNETVLHYDSSLLPKRPLARASWNYLIDPEPTAKPSVTYYMNLLQGLSVSHDFCVTLNGTQHIDPAKIIRKLTYHHPVYTPETLRAQVRRSEISGVNRTHYCGAYWGYGFHEDGVRSALQVCESFGRRL